MQIKILYDNEAMPRFVSGWGFSSLIGKDTLFDTGESSKSLLANMAAFDVAPEQIKRVVLSHEDWDHVGGLGVIKQCGRIMVYTPTGITAALRRKIKRLNPNALIVESEEDTDIGKKMFVTKTLGSGKKEISLVVKMTKGLVLVTGCAHPGLGRIMKHVCQHGDIYAVIGGLHGFNRLKSLTGLPVIVPCHCTKKKTAILRMFPGHARAVVAGMKIRI